MVEIPVIGWVLPLSLFLTSILTQWSKWGEKSILKFLACFFFFWLITSSRKKTKKSKKKSSL